MSTTWHQIPPASAADYQRSVSSKLYARNGLFWHEVRRCFFRPNLPFVVHYPDAIKPPLRAILGGYQYAVPEGQPANSTLNCLLFRDLASYSPATLSANHRREVKIAEKNLTIRPITDRKEFARKGHAIYLSFRARTNYRVGTDRDDPRKFAAWTERLFAFPELLILGGYHGDELAGLCISFLFGDTLTYATSFCSTESLKHYLPGLLLHRVRELAAAQSDIRQIFAGMKKRADGVDKFYLLRGARVVQLPAHLYLNPLVASILQRYRPAIHSHLLGILEPETRRIETSPT